MKCLEFLNKGNNRLLSPGVCEMEAEGVAYVTGKYFGFSNGDSLNCLALFGADTKLIQYNLDRIQGSATDLISRCSESCNVQKCSNVVK